MEPRRRKAREVPPNVAFLTRAPPEPDHQKIPETLRCKTCDDSKIAMVRWIRAIHPNPRSSASPCNGSQSVESVKSVSKMRCLRCAMARELTSRHIASWRLCGSIVRSRTDRRHGSCIASKTGALTTPITRAELGSGLLGTCMHNGTAKTQSSRSAAKRRILDPGSSRT